MEGYVVIRFCILFWLSPPTFFTDGMWRRTISIWQYWRLGRHEHVWLLDWGERLQETTVYCNERRGRLYIPSVIYILFRSSSGGRKRSSEKKVRKKPHKHRLGKNPIIQHTNPSLSKGAGEVNVPRRAAYFDSKRPGGYDPFLRHHVPNKTTSISIPTIQMTISLTKY